MNCPTLSFVPQSVHGTLVIMATLAYAGRGPGGRAGDDAVPALAKPHADLLRPMRYAELFPPDNPDFHPTAAARTMFVERIDHEAAATIIEHLGSSDASMRVAQVRVLGGAHGHVPVDATAYAHRGSGITTI